MLSAFSVNPLFVYIVCVLSGFPILVVVCILSAFLYFLLSAFYIVAVYTCICYRVSTFHVNTTSTKIKKKEILVMNIGLTSIKP